MVDRDGPPEHQRSDKMSGGAWLEAPAMNKAGQVRRNYMFMDNVTSTIHQDKGTITLESVYALGNGLPALHGKLKKI